MAHIPLTLPKKTSVQQHVLLEKWKVDVLESILSKLTQKEEAVKCRPTENEEEQVISLKVVSPNERLSLLASLDPKEQVLYEVLERFIPPI
jgi:helix-turn-helix protein